MLEVKPYLFEEDVTSNEELVQKAEQFLRVYHMDDLVQIAKEYPKRRRLVIDYTKLAQFDYVMADEFLENPDFYKEIFEYAAQQIEIPGAPKDMVIRVGIKNVPSVRKILIRDLSSEYIGKIVVLEGIVREVTDVMPRIKVAVWACKSCGNQIPVVQEGPVLKKPLSCPFCGKRDFELLEEKSKYTDFQKIRIQEPLEYLRGGEQSRHIAIYLEDDLVNRTAPGERIIVVGVLRIKKTQGKSTVQDKYIEALYIESVQKEFEELEPTPEELKKIKELAESPDIYDKLVASIAPAIKGHEKVKEAIALQLFGGVKKVLPDGTRIRGNIHILLLGDPGTGKSQMLEYAARLAPKSFYVAGKTVTGAGLTASAERDEFGEGGWVIKAGVLVLASGGLAAVDEFDKIDAKERQALHEAMEQQSYHYDFEIMLADGRKVKIGELVDKLIEENRDKVILGKNTEILKNPGVELLAYDLEKKEVVKVKADRVSRHVAPKEIVEILFSNGRAIKVTPEHPIMVWKDGEVREVPAEEVRIGDLAVGVNLHPLEEGEGIGVHVAKVLGFLASEGHVYKNEKNGVYEIGFSNTSKKLIEEFIDAFKEFSKQLVGKEIKASISVLKKNRKKPLYVVRITSKELYDTMKKKFPELFPKGETRPAKEKRVPNAIMRAPREEKIAFLNTFFKGDGFISPLRTGFITSSEKMAEDLQDLLYSLGVYSYIAKEEREAGVYYKVIVSGPESLKAFLSIIEDDPRSERVHKLLKKAIKKANHKDPLPKELVKLIKESLKLLRIDEGKLDKNLERGQNIHRERAKQFTRLIEQEIKRIEEALQKNDLKRARKILRISKEFEIPPSTLRYRLEKGDPETVRLVKEKIWEHLEKVKKNLRYLKGFIEGNIRFLRVKDVRRIPYEREWVYDVTVEPYHLFVTGGLVLHNTVSVAKAGIVTRFKAETSILAAANPKFGRFSEDEPIINQISVEPTILNRFDLMFVIREVKTADEDRKIASHILKTHKAGQMRVQYEKSPEAKVTKEEVEEAEEVVKPAIDPELLRKYVAYARTHVFPVLSPEAEEELLNFYVELRERGREKQTVPINARQMEALIRLAEASARVRLSPIITKEDAQRAKELLIYSMEEVLKDPSTGQIDVDILYTGMPKSKVQKLKTVLNIIRSITQTQEMASFDEIMAEASMYRLDKDEVEEIIEELKRRGDIIEPKRGYYTPV